MRVMEKETLSAKVRNYAIACSCAVFVFLVAGVVWGAFARQEPVNVWSTCTSDSADVFVGASGGDLKNVRCVALDREFFAEPEIAIGDLSRNGEDVCRFKPSEQDADAATPLRFEVLYDNGKVRREVCNWSNFAGGID